MDHTPGSDDMIAAAEDARRDEALDRWHTTHAFPGDWADVCGDCETEHNENKEN